MNKLTISTWVYLACLLAVTAAAQAPAVAQTPSIRSFIEQYSADVRSLDHRFRLPLDNAAAERRASITSDWLVQLRAQDFQRLDRINQIDYLLLRSELDYRQRKQELDWQRDMAAAKLLPFASELFTFCKAREDVMPMKPAEIAAKLTAAASAIDAELKAMVPIAATEYT